MRSGKGHSGRVYSSVALIDIGLLHFRCFDEGMAFLRLSLVNGSNNINAQLIGPAKPIAVQRQIGGSVVETRITNAVSEMGDRVPMEA